MIVLNEENRDLKNRLFLIPKGIKKHLRKSLSEYEKNDGDKNNKGYDHLKWLVSQEKVHTEELKRIKNFFDNYKGTDECDDYKLYGGKVMCDWVNATLEQAKNVSKIKKDANRDAGIDNSFKKEHERNGELETTKVGKSKIQLSNSINESKTIIITEAQAKRLKDIYNRINM